MIERLDELLVDEGVVPGRRRFPLGTDRCEGHSQAAPAAGGGDRRGDLATAAEPDHDVVRLGEQVDLRGQDAAAGDEPDGGQGALADDHGMDELDRDVAHVGLLLRRPADRDQAAAAGEALGHRVAEARDPGGMLGEEGRVGARAPVDLLVERAPDAVGRLGAGHAGWRSRANSRSQSRQASSPSPVRALISIRGTPGCTASRW